MWQNVIYFLRVCIPSFKSMLIVNSRGSNDWTALIQLIYSLPAALLRDLCYDITVASFPKYYFLNLKRHFNQSVDLLFILSHIQYLVNKHVQGTGSIVWCQNTVFMFTTVLFVLESKSKRNRLIKAFWGCRCHWLKVLKPTQAVKIQPKKLIYAWCLSLQRSTSLSEVIWMWAHKTQTAHQHRSVCSHVW